MGGSARRAAVTSSCGLSAAVFGGSGRTYDFGMGPTTIGSGLDKPALATVDADDATATVAVDVTESIALAIEIGASGLPFDLLDLLDFPPPALFEADGGTAEAEVGVEVASLSFAEEPVFADAAVGPAELAEDFEELEWGVLRK